mgnify:CR=1 FL=1
MKKKVLTVTIVAAIVAALMLVLTGCPTPTTPTDTVGPATPTVETPVASPDYWVKVKVSATDRTASGAATAGVKTFEATLTGVATLTDETTLSLSIPVTKTLGTATTTAAATLTFEIISEDATPVAEANVTVEAKAIDAAGNVSPVKVGAATTLTF